MDSSKILDFWCSPFRFAQSASISESDIYQYEMPIIFMGGRGTGKTMFLKYFSYETQRDEAFRVSPNNSRDPVMSYLKSRGGIGFYLRFDGPVLRSFKGRGVDEDKWDAIFTHYFELQVCKCYIKVIQDLLNRDRILKDKVEKGFIAEVARCFGKETAKLNTIEDILKKVEGELQEVISFRAQIAFSDVDFCPSKGFGSQDLSFRVAEIAKEKIGEFREDINFVILIDEYENFLERQQRIVNTLLKFVRPGVTFRIGMRLEGFHTFGTISDNEFIKEGRDYTKIIFEDFLTKDKEYRNFLRNVARKRLEAVPIFRNKGFLNISKFLGSKENLEEEACTLVEGRKNRHFESLDQATNKISVKEAKDAISCPDNPLLEMLNILWVLRGNEPDDIHNVMKDYLNGEKTEKVNKYRRDYIDKYKLSLMFLLASIYRANKKYYSFNTFCFISSGIVGHFI